MNTTNESALPGSTTGRALFGSAAALLIGGAFIAIQFLTDGWPGWPPREAWRWLPFVAAIAAVIPAVGTLLLRKRSSQLIVALATVILAAWMFHAPSTIGNSILWQSIAGGSALLLWLLLNPLTERRGGSLAMLSTTISVAASCIFIYYQLRFATLVMPLAGVAAVLVVLTIAMFIKPKVSWAAGAMLTTIIIHCSTLLLAWLYQREFTGVQWYCVVGVGLSPIGSWTILIPQLRRQPRVAFALGVLVTVVIAGMSIALAS